MNRSEADPFLQGYLDAALFTTDPTPPGGVDYIGCGRAEELFPRLPEWFISTARRACADFVVRVNAQDPTLLERAGDPWQNGADFWYTRNGHGVGFWDRGYPDEVGDVLSDIAVKFQEHYLDPEDLGLEGER